MCPCNYGRLGAFLLTACIYWAWVLGGLPVMIERLAAGNIMAIAWAVAAVLGVGNLWVGVREALAHDDEPDTVSVVWSLGVIGLCGWAMWHGWFFRSDWWWFNLSRCGWLAWMVAEFFGLWLQLRGRRGGCRLPVIEQPQPPRLRRRRRITIEEEIEGRGIAREHLAWLGKTAVHPPAHVSPDLMEHGGAVPQIVYIRDERTGQFIPVQLPDAVPVNRWLR